MEINLLEELKINFNVSHSKSLKFERIWSDEKLRYKDAVENIINKLKELGYKELKIVGSPYMLIENCKYQAVIRLEK